MQPVLPLCCSSVLACCFGTTRRTGRALLPLLPLLPLPPLPPLLPLQLPLLTGYALLQSCSC